MSHMTGLRKARQERGLTLHEAGKLTHYSYNAIGRAERGDLYKGDKKDKRRADFWRAMSDFYGKSIKELQEEVVE